MIRFFSLFSIMLLIISCNTPRRQENRDYVYADQMPEVLYYNGFLVSRPNNKNWFLLKSQQEYSYCIFWRMLPESEERNYHTIFFSVESGTISSNYPKSIEEFESIIRYNKSHIINTNRFELKGLNTEKLIKNGLWTIKYKFIVLDKKSPIARNVTLTMVNFGEVCQYPYYTNKFVVVDKCVSERGLINDITYDYIDEYNYLLDSVKFVK